jgi:CRISPR-associated protein Cmr3
MIWYELNPSDTLFFRGSESLEMGADHFAQSIFPPPVSVLYGALRTYILRKKGILFKDYSEKKCNKELYEQIGNPGQSIEDLPFTIYGPFFLIHEKVFIQTPLIWYGTELQEKKNTAQKIKFRYLQVLPNEIPIKASKPILWALNTDAKPNNWDMIPLTATWTEWNNAIAPPLDCTVEIYNNEHFFIAEPRTGIALHRSRKVRTGHLYSLTHFRLKEGVALCIGLDKEIGLDSRGTLFLGGENRFVRYEKATLQLQPIPEKGKIFLALSPIPATKEANNSVIVTEKLQYRGGWDLAYRFHKPLEAHFPAGSVFSSKISKHCIPIHG